MAPAAFLIVASFACQAYAFPSYTDSLSKRQADPNPWQPPPLGAGSSLILLSLCSELCTDALSQFVLRVRPLILLPTMASSIATVGTSLRRPCSKPFSTHSAWVSMPHLLVARILSTFAPQLRRKHAHLSTLTCSTLRMPSSTTDL